MGKSTYLITPAGPKSTNAQLRMLRDFLGHGLGLEGPFADKDGAVAEIADRVRLASGCIGLDPLNTTRIMLAPQNKLAKGDYPSLLSVPFILSPGPERGWGEYPESAGEVASIKPVEYEGGMARPARTTELSLLAVSVLRTLRVEGYLSMAACTVPQIEERISKPGTISTGVIVPAIIWPSGRETRMFSVVPDHKGILAASTTTTLEVLDDDAILSIVKVKNAWRHAQSLMKDIANHENEFEGERALRSIQIGHMIHDGMSLWGMMDAQADLVRAKGIFGPDNLDLDMSFRERVVQSLVRTMTNPEQHAMAAGIVMLPEEIKLKIRELEGSSNIFGFLNSIAEHPAALLLGEYFRSTFTMNEHIHPVSECKAGKRANA